MSEMIPTRIVKRKPIGSRPGWSSRPSTPTTAPTTISQTQNISEARR